MLWDQIVSCCFSLASYCVVEPVQLLHSSHYLVGSLIGDNRNLIVSTQTIIRCDDSKIRSEYFTVDYRDFNEAARSRDSSVSKNEYFENGFAFCSFSSTEITISYADIFRQNF